MLKPVHSTYGGHCSILKLSINKRLLCTQKVLSTYIQYVTIQNTSGRVQPSTGVSGMSADVSRVSRNQLQQAKKWNIYWGQIQQQLVGSKTQAIEHNMRGHEFDSADDVVREISMLSEISHTSCPAKQPHKQKGRGRKVCSRQILSRSGVTQGELV